MHPAGVRSEQHVRCPRRDEQQHVRLDLDPLGELADGLRGQLARAAIVERADGIDPAAQREVGGLPVQVGELGQFGDRQLLLRQQAVHGAEADRLRRPGHHGTASAWSASSSWEISVLPSMISITLASRYARAATAPSSAPVEPSTCTAAEDPRAAPAALTYLATTDAGTMSGEPSSQHRLACSQTRAAVCSAA